MNVNYVLQQSNNGNTAAARQSILNKASGTAKSGPWSKLSRTTMMRFVHVTDQSARFLGVVNKNSVTPPSGDVHDYLSWAP